MNQLKKGSIVCLIAILNFVGCAGEEGEIGPAGLNSLINISAEAEGVNCENGGVKVDSGIDKNNNGVLDNAEIVTTAYVCNGLKGDMGPAGLKSLINLSTEVAGDNCESGGVKVDSGIDQNDNGILDNSEITFTSYVCNGVEGLISLVNITDVSSGGNCRNGGIKITSGIDSDRNGMLDVSEVQVTRYVCNGIDGIVNEEIQIRLVDGIGTSANSTSTNPLIVHGISAFDIRNFPNVDSVVFVADPYVANRTNYARVELYNVTDSQVIPNSLLRTNRLHGERIQLKTNNVFGELPKKSINLGIKFSSETNGQFAASGIPYLFLYQSN